MEFPNEGWTQSGKDCMRCAIAFALNVHPTKVKHFEDKVKLTYYPWIERWDSYLQERFGKRIQHWRGEEYHTYYDHPIDDLLHNEREWIAVVPSLGIPNARHAINMKGEKLIHDSALIKKRVRKPYKFYYGYTLEDI